MWLWPVAVIGLVGLAVPARFGWRWTWGICLQQIIILIIALVGFVFLYAPLPAPYAVARHELATYAAIAAWTCVFVFNFGQRIVLNQLSLDLSLFRVQQAKARSGLVRLLTWGPPGQYWTDIAEALSCYNEGRVADGDAIVARWRNDSRMPSVAKESLVGFFMLGRVLLHDWHGIVSEFEKNESKLSAARTFVPYQMACRAYSELGDFIKAEACLKKANMQPTKTTATNLDINFMTMFALFGALDPLRDVFSRCRDERALPPYVRNFWLGRCHAVRGETAAALEAMRRSKETTPGDLETWHRRTDEHIAEQERILASGQPVQDRRAHSDLIGSVNGLYVRLRTIVDILRPTATRPGVTLLMVSLVAAYIISNADQFLQGLFDQQTLEYFHRMCYRYGELAAPRLLRGEWWTVVTYLYLHGNTAHLLLNTFALFLFGKSVENIYGTSRFLLIFFGAGIMSGVLQVALVPTDAAIGASGAILGVFGAAIAGIIKLKHILPDHIRKSELRWMISIAIAQVIFDQLVNGIAAVTDKSPNGVRIAAFAHLFGMVFGFILGMILPTRKFTSGGR
jgi:membrane associated rhomboid family serine protease